MSYSYYTKKRKKNIENKRVNFSITWYYFLCFHRSTLFEITQVPGNNFQKQLFSNFVEHSQHGKLKLCHSYPRAIFTSIYWSMKFEISSPSTYRDDFMETTESFRDRPTAFTWPTGSLKKEKVETSSTNGNNAWWLRCYSNEWVNIHYSCFRS